MKLPKAKNLNAEKYVVGLSLFNQKTAKIKLSANESALGPSPKAVKEYIKVSKDFKKYPDSDGTFLDWSNSELGEVAKDVTVVNLTFSFASRYYNVNDGEITGTSEHPMLVKDSNDGLFRFKELRGLLVGDKLIKSDSGTITEVNVDSITTSETTVEIVSIDVEEQDTYLVNGYITHNKGGNSFAQFAGPAAAAPTYANPAGAQNSTLNWVHPSATGTEGVTETQLQVDNNSDFSSLDATHSGTYSTTSVNVSGLSTGTWYARIRNREMGVWGSYSTALTFSHTFEN